MDARELFTSGFNCSQAVLLSFCNEFGLSEDTAKRIAAPFGGGIGRMREVCGAVSGACMVLGLALGDTERSELYKMTQELAEIFKKENGSIICGELLGIEREGYIPTARTDAFYKKRPCADYVEFAEKAVREYIACHK